MANEIQHRSPRLAHRIFGDSYCEWLSYSFRIERDAFHIAAFTDAVRAKGEDDDEGHTSFCAPRNELSDYHLHVWWRAGRSFRLRVEFVKGATKPAQDEREPYAEEFMEWVGKFFVGGTAESVVNSQFKIPSAIRQSRFLLPLKAEFGPPGTEARIDGISFTLEPEPEGVTKIWLTKEEENLAIHLVARKELDFSAFDPRNEINAFTRVLESIVEEKK